MNANLAMTFRTDEPVLLEMSHNKEKFMSLSADSLSDVDGSEIIVSLSCHTVPSDVCQDMSPVAIAEARRVVALISSADETLAALVGLLSALESHDVSALDDAVNAARAAITKAGVTS